MPVQPQPPHRLADIERMSRYEEFPVGLCVLDLKLRFLHICDKLADVNGKPVSEHLGLTLREVLPEVGSSLEPTYRSVIETGKPVLDLEIESTTPTQPGVVRHLVGDFYPLRNKDGGICCIGTVRSREASGRSKNSLGENVNAVGDSMSWNISMIRLPWTCALWITPCGFFTSTPGSRRSMAYPLMSTSAGRFETSFPSECNAGGGAAISRPRRSRAGTQGDHRDRRCRTASGNDDPAHTHAPGEERVDAFEPGSQLARHVNSVIAGKTLILLQA